MDSSWAKACTAFCYEGQQTASFLLFSAIIAGTAVLRDVYEKETGSARVYGQNVKFNLTVLIQGTWPLIGYVSNESDSNFIWKKNLILDFFSLNSSDLCHIKVTESLQ